ncbi:MAG: histidine phosphatase family protein [Alphaproteobacteria bacterium]|nr:histidine phosphatase family protein [Alphaproteobacteria bacterium]MBV9418867.1 histidine phosphatase family protein [Alphaproteobacteria bacterium]MBV9541842.1 histidine phosphatase family protein [Alphaproteobacteria bacterium]MBV9905080.1 histidine phosphatase family protein [Alphaproteobacteria bacterium]
MKRLLLLRHAKTEPAGAGVEDHDRKLMARGRDDAPKLGRYIREQGYAPELILSSTSRRTVETVELVTDVLPGTHRIDYLEALYLAEPDVMLSIIRLMPDKTRSVMVVGHNPGMEQLATFLAREPVKRRERDRFDQIEEKFPTAALAVLDFDVARWRDVAPGQGALKDFVRPRDL